MTAPKKPARKPREWRVWVRPDPGDELRRYGNVIARKEADQNDGCTQGARLILDPQRAPKGRKAKP